MIGVGFPFKAFQTDPNVFSTQKSRKALLINQKGCAVFVGTFHLALNANQLLIVAQVSLSQ